MIRRKWTVCRIGDEWHSLDRELESRFSSPTWYAAMTFARISAVAEVQNAWNESLSRQSINRLARMIEQIRDMDK
jgi:hypothetical protein